MYIYIHMFKYVYPQLMRLNGTGFSKKKYYRRDCSVLQCVAMFGSVVQSVAVCCSVL